MLHEGVGSLFEAVEGLSKAEIDGVGLASVLNWELQVNFLVECRVEEGRLNVYCVYREVEMDGESEEEHDCLATGRAGERFAVSSPRLFVTSANNSDLVFPHCVVRVEGQLEGELGGDRAMSGRDRLDEFEGAAVPEGVDFVLKSLVPHRPVGALLGLGERAGLGGGDCDGGEGEEVVAGSSGTAEWLIRGGTGVEFALTGGVERVVA